MQTILYRKYILFSCFTLCSLIGCNSFLDCEPDNRMTIDNLGKVAQLVTSAYQNDRSFRFTEVCSDNFTAVSGVTIIEPIIEDLYSWSRHFRTPSHQDAPEAYRNAAYTSIAAVNQALVSLEELRIAPADSGKAEAIKGEALIIRSYNHFMLVNLFAKHYHIPTASSDRGIPYVIKPEDRLKTDYEFETVENVYLKAEKDMLEGISLLEKSYKYFHPNKYHFTFPTVYLYAARFYTFRNRDGEDVKRAIAYAKKSIAAFGGIEVMRLWSAYATDEFGPIDINQGEVGMVQSSSTWILFNWAYGITNSIKTKQFKNPFGFTDSRLKIYYSASGDIFVPAFYFVYDPSDMNISGCDIFPLAEAVLCAAEGYAREDNISEALKYVGYLASKVYSNYKEASFTIAKMKERFEVDSDREALLQYILFERRMQFLLKGMRWFDIRRYDLDVEHLLRDGTTIRLSEITPEKNFEF